MAFHKVVGIDLGTTYSAVCVWDSDKEQVIVIPSAMGSSTLPSVVGLDPERKVIVGAPAQNNLAADPRNTVIEVKREMGVYEREPNPRPNDPELDDPGEPRRIHFRDRDYLPQEITAFILMELKRQAEHYLGEPVHDAVITVPAYFHEPQKGATEDAAAMARLNVKRLLNEPTAAAVCFGADKVTDGQKHVLAVYDLGGGTFDVSIIEVSKGNVSVVGTGGNPRLGGGDFDDRITGWVLQQIKEKHGVDLSRDHSVWQRIKRESEMRKRELSAATSAMINLPFLTADVSANIPVTRTIFEALIEDLLDDSVRCLDQAIESAYESNGIEREEIEQVLLVGGSTRIPCIRAKLAEHLGMDAGDIRVDVNPDEVVSAGAAIVARDYTPSVSYQGKEMSIDVSDQAPGGVPSDTESAAPGLVLHDVTSHTLGVLANQSDFVPIIPKESRLPTEVSQGGFTNGGQFPAVNVLIFQGEDPVAFNNTLIGKLPIELPEPKEAGYYKFEVTFGLNSDGLLKASVIETKLQKTWKAEVQCNVRATKEQIDSSAQHLADVMAAESSDSGVEAVGVSGGGLPTPPSPEGLPKPPVAAGLPKSAATAAGAPTVPAGDSIPEPPQDVPEQFRSIARRTFKAVSKAPPGNKREKLLASYMAFVDAVVTESSEIDDLGDTLEEAYIDCR